MAIGDTKADDGEADATPRRPPDPVPWPGIVLLGIYFFGVALFTFYFLVATWPVPDPKEATAFVDFSLFGWRRLSASSDLRLFLTVIAAGALGSLIHTLTSFADYVGNRALSISWIWWLILRVPIGVALALLFYAVIRGGMIVPSLPNSGDTTCLLNPYGIAAISALAGMFSKQATDKLRELFDTVFRTREPVNRADPLTRAIPVISSTDPAKLTVNGPLAVDVRGSRFARDCAATINGNSRDVQWISDTLLKLVLLPEDVATKRELNLIVRNPGSTGGSSEPFTIRVESQ